MFKLKVLLISNCISSSSDINEITSAICINIIDVYLSFTVNCWSSWSPHIHIIKISCSMIQISVQEKHINTPYILKGITTNYMLTHFMETFLVTKWRSKMFFKCFRMVRFWLKYWVVYVLLSKDRVKRDYSGLIIWPSFGKKKFKFSWKLNIIHGGEL